MQPFYGVETFALTSRLAATVNLATGNLVLASDDVALNSPGVGLHLSSFVNSLAAGSGSLGVHGVASTGQDVGLKVASSTVTFYGPSGFTATFTASGSGWKAPAGVNADLVHASDGSWTLTYHSSGERLTFTAGGYLVSDVDRNGAGLALGYDTSNRVVSITDAVGRVTSLGYTSAGLVQSVTDPFGRETRYLYDSATGTVLNAINYPDGSQVRYSGSGGKVTKVTTGQGNYVTFGYDSAGRLSTLKRFLTAGSSSGAAAASAFSYPSSGVAKETNPLGGVSTFTLDSSGRVTKVVDPLGRSRSVTWTPNSDIATATDAMGSGTTQGNTVRYSYDSANNATAVALPTGAAAAASYAQDSSCASTDTSHPFLPKCATDAAGNRTSLVYDSAGNVTSSTDTTAGGTGAVSFSYTRQSASSSGTQCGGVAGQVCTATDGDGAVTSYRYDASGNLTKVSPPSPGKATVYAYDGASRVVSVTDGAGVTTSYAYDAGDRITKTTLSGGASITATYDKDGNKLKSVDSAAGTATYGYDPLGREVRRRLPGMTSDFTTSYDDAGDVTGVSDPGGQVVYSYDAASQLSKVVEPEGAVTTFTYDANGRESTRALPNGITQTITYDASGRATGIKAAKGANVVSDLGYSYAAPGTGTATSRDRALVMSRTDAVGIGGPPGSGTAYGYDSLNRLTSAVEKTSSGAPSASWAYAYDRAGNRTSATTAGATRDGLGASTPSATTTWGYNGADRITSRNGSSAGWAYDDAGNQTSSPDWGSAKYDSARASMTSLTPPGASSPTNVFGYLGTGNAARITKDGDPYVLGTLGLAARYTNSTFAYRRTPDGQVLSTRNNSGGQRYFLTDNLGFTVAITDTTGNVTARYAYDPYGSTRTATGSDAGNEIRYTGGFYDNDSHLYHLGARYYDPATGRFTQPDPSGQEINPYTYTDDNPVNYVDPAGTSNFTRAVVIIGAVAIAAGIAAAFLPVETTAGAIVLAISIILGEPVGVVAIACEFTEACP